MSTNLHRHAPKINKKAFQEEWWSLEEQRRNKLWKKNSVFTPIKLIVLQFSKVCLITDTKNCAKLKEQRVFIAHNLKDLKASPEEETIPNVMMMFYSFYPWGSTSTGWHLVKISASKHVSMQKKKHFICLPLPDEWNVELPREGHTEMKRYDSH